MLRVKLNRLIENVWKIIHTKEKCIANSWFIQEYKIHWRIEFCFYIFSLASLLFYFSRYHLFCRHVYSVEGEETRPEQLSFVVFFLELNLEKAREKCKAVKHRNVILFDHGLSQLCIYTNWKLVQVSKEETIYYSVSFSVEKMVRLFCIWKKIYHILCSC